MLAGPYAFYVSLAVISTRFFFSHHIHLIVKSVHKRRGLLYFFRLCSLYLKLCTERTEALSPCSLQYVASHFAMCPPSASPSPAKYRGVCRNHQAADAVLRAWAVPQQNSSAELLASVHFPWSRSIFLACIWQVWIRESYYHTGCGLSCPCGMSRLTAGFACSAGQWVPAEMALGAGCSELLPQLRFLIVVDYIWIGCSDWGEQSVLSQSSTVVQISHQMFLIQAQNLLSCPQGKSGSMLLSIAAAGPVSRLGWAGSSVNQYDVWLLLMSPDYWHFKKVL